MKSRTWCGILKEQGAPEYLEAVTEEESDERRASMTTKDMANSGDELYDQAVAVVRKDARSRLAISSAGCIGYNRAATLIERMEKEGLIGAANHAGKREILVGGDEAVSPY